MVFVPALILHYRPTNDLAYRTSSQYLQAVAIVEVPDFKTAISATCYKSLK